MGFFCKALRGTAEAAVHGAGGPARQMFWGDILLVGCCVFYLLWWILAFRPTGAVKGMRSGWLLIPAFLLGCASAVLIVRGAVGGNGANRFFSAGTVLLAGVVSYAALLLLTRFALHRQVTTELFLIVGWTVLTALEVNALYGLGAVARSGAAVLLAAAVMAALVSMVCYVLYYGLDDRAGYVDGMIPLLLAGAFMAVLAALIARSLLRG